MNLTEKFLGFALLGAEWVMWLLVVLSIISVAVMIERLRFILSRRVDIDALRHDAVVCLGKKDPEGFDKKYGASDSIQAAVGLAGLRAAPRGSEAAAEAMIAAKTRKRKELEKNLAYLGTLGNNAPFIGLFGTVIGIIKAFKDLADNSQKGAEAVMSGISEALVATAIGLLVALPAVMMFNYLNRRVRGAVSEADALAHDLLSELRSTSKDAAREAA
jgi:biopolymer transport protein ExbB/TolQ